MSFFNNFGDVGKTGGLAQTISMSRNQQRRWALIGGLCVACVLCASVFTTAESGNRSTWRLSTKLLQLAEQLPWYTLPLCLLVQAGLLRDPCNLLVHTEPGLQYRGARLGGGVPHPNGVLDDVAHELCPQFMGPGAIHVGLLHGEGVCYSGPLLQNSRLQSLLA